MGFELRLERALRRRELLREALRRHGQRRTLREAPRQIQEGPYYWLPMPGGDWELMSWYVSDYGQDNTDHVRVWRLSAAPYLAERWGLSPGRLEELPFSVPRGRVSKGHGAVYINHGDDAPVPREEMVKRVCREFNLTGLLLNNPSKLKVSLDNHERINRGERARLQAILDQARSAIAV